MIEQSLKQLQENGQESMLCEENNSFELQILKITMHVVELKN